MFPEYPEGKIVEMMILLQQNRTQIGMFRPIRMDHTNCLQVVMKTISFQNLELAPNGSKQTDVREDHSYRDCKERGVGRSTITVAVQFHEMKSPCRVYVFSP